MSETNIDETVVDAVVETAPVPVGTATASVRIITLKDILAAADVSEQTVEVPEWGGAVVVRSLTKRDMDIIRKQATVKDQFGEDTVDTDLVEKFSFVAGMVDPRVSEEEYEIFKDKSFLVVGRIQQAILGASGEVKEAVKKEERQFPV